MKKGILLVAHGTSDRIAARAHDNVERLVRERFSGVGLRWAFTSGRARQDHPGRGVDAPAPADALSQMHAEGYTHVAVQSLHLVQGGEYERLREALDVTQATGAPPPLQLSVGRPLMNSFSDLQNVCSALLASLPRDREAGDAVILVGHGSRIPSAELAYLAAAGVLGTLDPLAFVGSTIGHPDLGTVLKRCRESDVHRAYLLPFMAVAAHHARQDVGETWRAALEDTGIECIPVLKGLAESDTVAALWVDHLEAAVEAFAQPTDEAHGIAPAAGSAAEASQEATSGEGTPDDDSWAGASPIFPIGMLLRERTCTVVGGGKVALRKVRGLLAAGAKVTVVSPELVDQLTALVRAGKVAHAARAFTPPDVHGSALVFAATNEPAVNRNVLQGCREAGIPVCRVDRGWTGGDFVTPAVLRESDLTVAVSTGGSSCRRAKLVRNSLARHVRMVDRARLLVLGTSHEHLPIARREAFQLSSQAAETTGAMIMQLWGIHEFALLNTCNRIELLAVATGSPTLEGALERLLGFDRLDRDEYYLKHDEGAFAHMALTLAGLLSQTPGETHIVAQVKSAVEGATAYGWAGGMLQQWLSSALHISKHVRQATRSLLIQQDIEDLAMNYIDQNAPERPEGRVLVIGTGVVGKHIVRRLVPGSHALTWCYHRRQPDLPASLADAIELRGLDALPEIIATADIILCATASEEPVLRAHHAACFSQEHPTLVVDLAMPRNVAPELDHATASRVQVVDLDDLKHWYRREVADMTQILNVADTIIGQHKEMYAKLMESFQGRNEKQ